ncbi:MAG: hypothetical protein JEZ08_18075 [Clostridiales bacterium]|nr:hypothetical protein [Clostridiales bacterium]
MKIVIAILIVLLAFLGFQVYGIIVDEIDEAQVSSIQIIDDEKVTTISVDNISDIKSYSHRVSTYEHTSSDLVTASSNHLADLNVSSYITIFYYNEDKLIGEEFDIESELIELNTFYKECLIVLSNEKTLTTNLKEKELTFYNVESYHLIHIEPKQTGLYELSFEETKITFENLEKK